MLKEKLLSDLKSAMQEKNTLKKDVITMIRASILQYEKDNKVELDDNKITEIIAKELKKRKDVLPDYEKSGRQDLIEKINEEIKVVSEYLPEELSVQELTKIIEEIIKETGASSMKDMGKIMQGVKAKVGARADGRTINEIVKQKLV